MRRIVLLFMLTSLALTAQPIAKVSAFGEKTIYCEGGAGYAESDSIIPDATTANYDTCTTVRVRFRYSGYSGTWQYSYAGFKMIFCYLCSGVIGGGHGWLNSWDQWVSTTT